MKPKILNFPWIGPDTVGWQMADFLGEQATRSFSIQSKTPLLVLFFTRDARRAERVERIENAR